MISSRLALRGGFGVALAMSVVAGSCDIHDNTINIPNASVNFTTTADVTNVDPGQEVPVNVTVKNVYLVDPNEAPPAEHVKDAGHVQVYLDSVSTTALIVTAQPTFNVPVPKETKAGNHKLICRVHKHDGTPTSTTMEIAITVTVTVAGDGGVSVTVDASTDTHANGGQTGTSGTGGAAGAAAGTGAGGKSGVGGYGGTDPATGTDGVGGAGT